MDGEKWWWRNTRKIRWRVLVKWEREEHEKKREGKRGERLLFFFSGRERRTDKSQEILNRVWRGGEGDKDPKIGNEGKEIIKEKFQYTGGRSIDQSIPWTGLVSPDGNKRWDKGMRKVERRKRKRKRRRRRRILTCWCTFGVWCSSDSTLVLFIYLFYF